MFKKMKMGTKLILIGSLIMLIPLAAVTVVSVNRSRAALESLGHDELILRATDIATTIDRVCREEQKLIAGIASDPDIVSAAVAINSSGAAKSADAIKRVNAKLMPYGRDPALAGSYEAVTFIGMDGVVYGSSLATSLGKDISQRDYVKLALLGKANVGSVLASAVTSKPVVPIATPVLSDGKVVGACALVVNASFMTELIDTVKIGQTGYAVVVDGTGLTIAHPNTDYILKLNLVETEGMTEFGKEMVAGKTGYDGYVLSGVQKIAGYAPVAAAGWSVAVTMARSDDAFGTAATTLQTLLLALSGACLVVAIFIFYLFSRSITRPIIQGVEFARKMSQGDFTHTLGLHRGDEIGVLANALDAMSETLRTMVGSIQQNAEQVASSSEEISASSQRLAEGAQSQASTLEETSASVEQLSASVDLVSEHSQSQAGLVDKGTRSMTDVESSITEASAHLAEISTLAQKSVENAQAGAKAVTEVMEGIGRIAESSERIGGIVNVISDIADQTNLLSLNASIEAARAGEHGRGFAVVADEVSKLAERSAASTKEIESLIKESMKRVTDGVQTARGSQDAMERIRAASHQVSTMINGVSESMDRQVVSIRSLSATLGNVNEMSQSISAAASEQSTNTKQVSKAVENVNEITQSAASAAEEMSTATEQLARMAQELQKLVAGFKIGTENAEASGTVGAVGLALVPGHSTTA